MLRRSFFSLLAALPIPFFGRRKTANPGLTLPAPCCDCGKPVGWKDRKSFVTEGDGRWCRGQDGSVVKDNANLRVLCWSCQEKRWNDEV